MSTSSTVSIALDQGCCRCKTKIQKILCCLEERCGFVFDKVEYEKDKVLISGPFNVIDLCCKLRCKAGCLANKMEIVPPPPPPEPKKKKKKKKKPTPPPVDTKPPEPVIKCFYPCPYPCPNPQPTCPSSCVTPPRPCQCHSCRPPPPCPPPAPPPCPPPPAPPCPPPAPPCPKPPQPCPPPVCNKCPIWTPCQCRGSPWVFFCEENRPPDGACAVM